MHIARRNQHALPERDEQQRRGEVLHGNGIEPLAAAARGELPVARIGAEELVRIGNDQRLTGQLMQPDGGMRHERMPVGEHEIGFMPAHEHGPAPLRQIEVAAWRKDDVVALKRVAGHSRKHLEMEINAGILPQKGGKERADVGRAGDFRRAADTQPPLRRGDVPAQLALRPAALAEDPAGARGEQASGLGQRDGMGAAHEQLRAKLLLHPLNVLGEGRLGEKERLRRPAEAERLREDRELIQILGFHGANPPFAGRALRRARHMRANGPDSCRRPKNQNKCFFLYPHCTAQRRGFQADHPVFSEESQQINRISKCAHPLFIPEGGCYAFG